MVKFSKKVLVSADFWVSPNHKYSNFYAGSWQTSESALPLLIIRVFVAAGIISILTWSLSNGGVFWPIFLTNWGLALLFLMNISAVYVSCRAYTKQFHESAESRLPWYVRVYWVLFNIAVTISFTITILYWLLLFEPGVLSLQEMWLDIATHGITSVLAMIELVTSRTPVYIINLIQPLAVGIGYALFTAVYYSVGGTDKLGNPYIYKIINWKKWKPTLGIVVGSIAGMVVVYLVVWCIASARDRASTKLCRSESVKLQQAPPNNHSDSCPA